MKRSCQFKRNILNRDFSHAQKLRLGILLFSTFRCVWDPAFGRVLPDAGSSGPSAAYNPMRTHPSSSSGMFSIHMCRSSSASKDTRVSRIPSAAGSLSSPVSPLLPLGEEFYRCLPDAHPGSLPKLLRPCADTPSIFRLRDSAVLRLFPLFLSRFSPFL